MSENISSDDRFLEYVEKLKNLKCSQCHQPLNGEAIIYDDGVRPFDKAHKGLVHEECVEEFAKAGSSAS